MDHTPPKSPPPTTSHVAPFHPIIPPPNNPPPAPPGGPCPPAPPRNVRHEDAAGIPEEAAGIEGGSGSIVENRERANVIDRSRADSRSEGSPARAIPCP